MLDYDEEAPSYDETRGGEARAEAAAAALAGLVSGNRCWLEVAGGTGSVAAHLRARGHQVFVLDRSYGMLRRAAGRGCACVQGDATVLPVRSASVDVVSVIWLLHLLHDPEPVVAEAARVLRPGGVWLTTVDKASAHHRHRRGASDARERVTARAARHGLEPTGEAVFVGHGQARPGGVDPVFTVVSFLRDD